MISAFGRLVLVLVLGSILVTACVGTSGGGSPMPASSSTPAAPVINRAAAPQQTATPASESVGPADEGSDVSQSEMPDGAPPAPADLTSAVDTQPNATLPIDVSSNGFPSSYPIQTVGSSRGVPILMYHYIRVNPVATDKIGYGLSIPPADFEAQMAYLESHGYRSVTLADIASGAAFKGSGRPVAITFDDGYDDAYTVAYPILTRHHFRATFYIITEVVDRPRYMTWAQVRALAAAGNLIGSHTVSHLDLTRLDVVSLYAQLAVSRSTLEARLGQPVLDFCYPAGRFNPTVKSMVASVGYRTATTVKPGLARRGDDLLALPRVRVFGGVTLDQFAKLLQGVMPVRPTRTPATATRAPAS